MDQLRIHIAAGVPFRYEQEMRNAVEIGNPWALDGLIEEISGQSDDLKVVVVQIVADEYRSRVRKLPREEALRPCREFCVDEHDPSKDSLPGEVREDVIQEN